MSLRLRGILPEDSALLLRWRNDPETRRNSINTAEVRPEEHALWFHKMMILDPQRIAVAHLDGLPVGVVRLDWNEGHDSCELFFTVAPEHRRKGFGFSIVQQQIEDLSNLRVLARVKTANLGSRRIFDRLGFRVIDCLGDLLLYAKGPADEVAVGAASPVHALHHSEAAGTSPATAVPS
jgi:UDP-2,4-diacetamido-2,4,6-trideoxy-beta-L-altropyranose hydrolase